MMAKASTGWKRMSWGELATLEYGKGLRDYQNAIEQYPVFGTNGQIGWHSEYLCSCEGVIVGRKGAYRGVHYSKRPFFVIDTAFYLKPIVDGIFNMRWAYYQLLNFDINRIDSGTAIPSTSRDAFYAIGVNVPPLPIQRKIAGILSAYDDLIENNLRRIKILEEMAQNLYREWFVKYRFPGHEKVKMVDSPLGKIPEGWEVKPLSNVCIIVMGQSPKSQYYNTSGKGLPFHQGVTDFGERFPTDRVFCTIQNRIAEQDDVLFSVRAPVGRINLSDKRIVLGRGLCAIRNHQNYQWFTFHQLHDKFQDEDTMGSGAIFKAVTKADMERIEFLVPHHSLIKRFQDICYPIESHIHILTHKNSILRRTRDLLLPRLISGELDVSEMDIKTIDEA